MPYTTFQAPVVEEPDVIWAGHDLSTPVNLPHRGPIQLTVSEAIAHPERITLAPLWSIPPIFQPEHAHRIPFFQVVPSIHVSQLRTLSNQSDRLWDFGAIFPSTTAESRAIFDSFIQGSIPPVLLKPRWACSCCKANNKSYLKDVDPKRTSWCLFATAGPPTQDADGVISFTAACFYCVGHGTECRIAPDGQRRAQILRFVIDPEPGRPDHFAEPQRDIEESEQEHEDDDSFSLSTLESSSSTSSGSESASDEAPRRVAVVSNSRKRRIHIAAKTKDQALKVLRVKRRRINYGATATKSLRPSIEVPAALSEANWSVLSSSQVESLKDYLSLVEIGHTQARRITQLECGLAGYEAREEEWKKQENEVEQLKRELQEAKLEVSRLKTGMDDLQDTKAVYIAPARPHQSQLASSSIVAAQSVPALPATPRTAAAFEAIRAPLVVEPQNWRPDRGFAALPRDAAIILDRHTNRPVLVGTFEQRKVTQLLRSEDKNDWLVPLLEDRSYFH